MAKDSKKVNLKVIKNTSPNKSGNLKASNNNHSSWKALQLKPT